MGGGVIESTFDLQRFAQVDNPYEFDIDTNKVTDIKIKIMVDLIYYAQNNIANYQTVTEIPQENIEYLSSGLCASSCSNMFNVCYELTSIPWNEFNIDTSQCTSMAYMFNKCYNIYTLNLTGIDTGYCTNMGYMFAYDNIREIICPDGFDLSSCTSVNYMFESCDLYIGEPLHFKNVPRSLDLSTTGGTEGIHYVIDFYKD